MAPLRCSLYWANKTFEKLQCKYSHGYEVNSSPSNPQYGLYHLFCECKVLNVIIWSALAFVVTGLQETTIYTILCELGRVCLRENTKSPCLKCEAAGGDLGSILHVNPLFSFLSPVLNEFLALALWLATKCNAVKALRFGGESVLKASWTHWRALSIYCAERAKFETLTCRDKFIFQGGLLVFSLKCTLLCLLGHRILCGILTGHFPHCKETFQIRLHFQLILPAFGFYIRVRRLRQHREMRRVSHRYM